MRRPGIWRSWWCLRSGGWSRPGIVMSLTGWSIAFFRDLLAAGRSESTVRSYGMDLLRWFRFVWAAEGVAWDRPCSPERVPSRQVGPPDNSGQPLTRAHQSGGPRRRRPPPGDVRPGPAHRAGRVWLIFFGRFPSEVRNGNLPDAGPDFLIDYLKSCAVRDRSPLRRGFISM